MSVKSDENQSAKVLKLGLNISVSGDPDADFEIVLDDKEQKSIQPSLTKEEKLQRFDVLEVENSASDAPKKEFERGNVQDVKHTQSIGAILKQRKMSNSPEQGKMSGSESAEDSTPQEINIISKIKSTMEHFEKFSDHIKEIPRLRNRPLATSTPFSDKYNSRSESSLVYAETRPRKFSHLYDYHPRKDYFNYSFKHSPQDLFLKPLPGEGYHTRGVYTRYFDFEPYQHYGSENSLIKSDTRGIYGRTSHDLDKYEGSLGEPLVGILKKSDSESGDKQSTSSADSVKDIKIYQSGGILIMQNFKENMDATEKKEMSEFSAKLIENCNKLKMEVCGFQDKKPAIGNFSDETKNSGKMVQFDLSSCEGQKSKSGDSNAIKDEASVRMESSESTSDCMKNKESSPQGTSQSQDFTSLSTQENDSVMSNAPGMSPTYASAKKLEWDSGADIGYLNLDLTKENLSTIEKIVLKGLSSDGLSEENLVYEKKQKPNQKTRTKLTQERSPSDSGVEQLAESIKSDSCRKKISSRQEKGNSENAMEKKKNSGKNLPKESCKGEPQLKPEEVENSTKEPSAPQINEPQTSGKPPELSDKSVNVNTLFENVTWRTPSDQSLPRARIRPSESPTKITQRRASKAKISKHKIRTSPTRSLKTSKKPTISGPLVTSYFDMGNSKKVYKNVEESPVLNDVELSREVEEIIIDQRFKITQNVASGREMTRESNVPVKEKADKSKEGKTKGRPISASSSSNNTVLPKSDFGEQVEEKTKKNTREQVTDQMIQTSDYDCTSIGVQAFASQMSSDCDYKSLKKNEQTSKRVNVNTSSKNIQAFGLNSSLPKQLEHPKGVESVQKQNTKSTQYFGGPVNSLPNYHSNLVTKPGESCGRVPNVLKQKRNLEAEIIRVKEENEKNILANDVPIEPVKESRRSDHNENKENLISQKSSHSKKSQSNASRKTSESEKKESEGVHEKGKKKSGSFEGSDGHPTSDDVSSLVLTSEVLKVHGDSIDRNIIQEKYFQSQLVELEKRKMISRSTSMEIQLLSEDDAKEFVTTGCQYSPQSWGTSGGQNQEVEDGSYKETSERKIRNGASSEPYGLTGNQYQNAETGDSLPSSTQTAHSWVPGMRNSRENLAGVGKARSFEYLPGHIYESSGNLREELPSETEQNLITSSSSDSDTARGSVSNGGARDSEGRRTLILENSTEGSSDSDRLKILDENLMQLNVALTKLREKDAQVQDITKSLLASLCVKNGSGDWLPLVLAKTEEMALAERDRFNSSLGSFVKRAVNAFENSENGTEKQCGFQALRPFVVRLLMKRNRDLFKKYLNKRAGIDTSKTEVEQKDSIDNGRPSSEVTAQRNEREFSFACQTEEKTPSSNADKFFEERKAFEKRISEEKKCQIKWIENEICHLNILRRLLEKQNTPVEGKKKRSVHSVTSNDTSKSEGKGEKNICTEICPRPVTPVYGCTISLSENLPLDNCRPCSEQSNRRESDTCPQQYGLALSLSGSSKNWRRVLMLPVGVQVSLKDGSLADCSEVLDEDVDQRRSSLKHGQQETSDVYTQCPSVRRNSGNFPSTSVQADLPSQRSHCTKENCFCINLSDKSGSFSLKSRTSERRESPRLHFINEECGTENENRTNHSTDPEFLEMANNTEKITYKNAEGYLTESSTKSKLSTSCKCQNCPKRVSSNVGKHGITCRGPCQSNIYLNYEKPSEECRCSKIQVQKSPSCACHVIKIHGSKCCSSERNSCSCKRRNHAKKTENQACQTECDSVPGTDNVEKLSKAKVETERRGSVMEKLPCDPTGLYDELYSCSDKLQQNAVERSTEVPVRDIPSLPNCNCRKKAEKMKIDDHPRHYFLRIKETEMDDSVEQVEQKKSLEVVTVTIPVKRAGKSKICGCNVRQTRENLDFPQLPVKSCNCCAQCMRNCNKSQPEREPRVNLDYRRIRAEKPESPNKMRSSSKSPECFSFEEFSFPSGVIEESIPEDCRGSYSEKPDHESQCCEGCNCINRYSPPSRDVQNEYDSHKKRRNGNAKELRDCEGGRIYEENRKGKRGGGLNWRDDPPRNQVLNSGSDRYNSEYYNYNKREFMTKSELLKEEEHNRKVYQPSLQECLSSNRPDFYSSAERRRQIISERAKERVQKHNSRMECLMKMMQQCNQNQEPSNAGSKRIFTTVQMKEQTMKRYRKLPEVTGKIADERKKEEYRTNRLMADIFAKKLQSEALKGHINLSNSVSVLYTI